MEGWRQLEEEEWHWRHRQRLSVCSSFNDMTTDDLQVAFCSVKSESYLRKYLLYCKSLYWLDYWIDCWCFKRSPEAIYFNRDSFVRSQSYITLSAAASKSKNSNIFSSDRRTRQRSNLRRKGKKERNVAAWLKNSFSGVRINEPRRPKEDIYMNMKNIGFLCRIQLPVLQPQGRKLMSRWQLMTL